MLKRGSVSIGLNTMFLQVCKSMVHYGTIEVIFFEKKHFLIDIKRRDNLATPTGLFFLTKMMKANDKKLRPKIVIIHRHFAWTDCLNENR